MGEQGLWRKTVKREMKRAEKNGYVKQLKALRRGGAPQWIPLSDGLTGDIQEVGVNHTKYQNTFTELNAGLRRARDAAIMQMEGRDALMGRVAAYQTEEISQRQGSSEDPGLQQLLNMPK
jgi:hypothetical protein